MECTVTCFERVLNLVTPLPDDKIQEGLEIIEEYSLQDLLDFCVENNCFTQEQASTLYEGIIMWEDLDGTYFEEDRDKLLDLYDRLGLDNGNVKVTVVKEAEFTSLFDDGTEITTKCKVDLNTHSIFDIAVVETSNSIGSLEQEYIYFEGGYYDVDYDAENNPYFVVNEYGGPFGYAVETYQIKEDGTEEYIVRENTFNFFSNAKQAFDNMCLKNREPNVIHKLMAIEYDPELNERNTFCHLSETKGD